MIYRFVMSVLLALMIGWTAFGTAAYFHDKKILGRTSACLKREIDRRGDELWPGGRIDSKTYWFAPEDVRKIEQTCNARSLGWNVNEMGLQYLSAGGFASTQLWLSDEPELFDMVLLGLVAGVLAALLAVSREMVLIFRRVPA